jgi:cytochrome c oxidase cbb3-type subunit III
MDVIVNGTAKRVLLVLTLVSLDGLQTQAQRAHPPSATHGQPIFVSSCAGCHGLDGRGGERGPNITGSAKVQRMSDAQILRIVSDGISGTGMPAFHSLSETERQAVVAYLRTLQGRSRIVAAPGNAVAGKALFSGKAGCSGCHMVGGEGGFLGSDLSSYARGKSVQQIRNAILNSGLEPDSRKKVATAVTRDNQTLSGVIRNQDNFSVQLQTRDGAFHLLQKSDLASLNIGPQSVMPSDYKQKLNATELDDLVSYLMNAARTVKPAHVVHQEE